MSWVPKASQRPSRLATEPGLQLKVGRVGTPALGKTPCDCWLPAFRRSEITGRPGSASITTEPVEDIRAELVAVKVTSRLSNGDELPSWWMGPAGACGVQRKLPVAGSNEAPAGRLAADRVSGKSPGSTAEKVKANGCPNAASSVPGRFRIGAVAGVTAAELVTEVCPNCTVTADDCCPARGVVKTSKLSCACPGRVVNGLGSSKLVLSLETDRRATCSTFGMFMPTVHVRNRRLGPSAVRMKGWWAECR